MTIPAKLNRKACYDDILKLPDNVVGEIVAGELVVSPRPTALHALAEDGLTEELRGPFQSGKGGGPGGWWIISEPELHLGDDIFVPDLAGWKRQRMPNKPVEPYLTLVPDWVCEIVSPSTASLDRMKKMPKYAEHGVTYLWLLDPQPKTLDAFVLENNRWVLVSSLVGDMKGKIIPFNAVEIDLKIVWGDVSDATKPA